MAAPVVRDENRLLAVGATKQSVCGRRADGRRDIAVRAIEAVGCGALVVIVALAPWFYGSTSPIVLEALTGVVAILGVLWAVRGALTGMIEFVWSPIHALFLMIVVLGVIHLLPLPIAVRSLGSGADLLGSGLDRWNRITLDPRATAEAVWRLGVLFGFFFLMTSLVRTRRRAATVMWAVTISGCVLSVVALFNHVAPEKAILWRFGPDSVAFGPFANRAHFAAFVEMIFPVALVRLVGSGGPMIAAAALMMSLAVLLSASRAGIVLLVLEAVGVIALCGSRRARGVLLVCILILAPVGAALVGSEGALHRMARRFTEDTRGENGRASVNRLMIWRATGAMIADNPVLGVGLGAFAVAYPRYDEGNGLYSTTHAHNAYLQIVSETGLVGGIACFLFLFYGGRTAYRVIRRAQAQQRPLALAVAVGGGAVVLHSLVDVPLHVGANALVFLSGVAVLLTLGKTRADAADRCAEGLADRLRAREIPPRERERPLALAVAVGGGAVVLHSLVDVPLHDSRSARDTWTPRQGSRKRWFGRWSPTRGEHS